ncbi:MAG: hypothetical protein ACP5GZ_11845 [Vulcanisaeta sp.]|jgi:hypothetical protein|uniref:hypothetical protein n=1 Tax=Vulcanisaeta sp. TaxID=2020871 RepID=UPI003D14B4C3
MSIEEAKDRLLALRDALIRIDSINNVLDALPRLLLETLLIIGIVLGTYTLFSIWYVITMPVRMNFLSTIGALISIALLLAIPAYVYLRIERLSKVMDRYANWIEVINRGISGILEILSTLDFVSIEYRINRARAGYILFIVVKLLALAILLLIIASFVTFWITAIFGYAEPPTWLFATITIIIIIIVTLGLEWDSLVNDVKRLWSLSGLIIELRWLYHELQGIQT